MMKLLRGIFAILAILIIASFVYAATDPTDEAILGVRRWRVATGGTFCPASSSYSIGDSTNPLGNIYLSGYRSAVTGYVNYLDLTGALTGTGAAGNTRGIYVGLTRSVNTTVGDQNDIGVEVKMSNTASANTAGNTLSGVVSQASNTSSGVISNLTGGEFTAYNKNTGGAVVNAVGLKASAKANNSVTGNLIGLQVEYNRQAAVVPTHESIVDLNCNSMTGAGIDSAIDINSIYADSASTDSIDNGIDMSGATINKAQIITSGGPKIFSGTAATGAAVYAEVGTYDATGSMYMSTTGIFVQVANTGAETDWERVDSTDSD